MAKNRGSGPSQRAAMQRQLRASVLQHNEQDDQVWQTPLPDPLTMGMAAGAAASSRWGSGQTVAGATEAALREAQRLTARNAAVAAPRAAAPLAGAASWLPGMPVRAAGPHGLDTAGRAVHALQQSAHPLARTYGGLSGTAPAASPGANRLAQLRAFSPLGLALFKLSAMRPDLGEVIARHNPQLVSPGPAVPPPSESLPGVPEGAFPAAPAGSAPASPGAPSPGSTVMLPAWQLDTGPEGEAANLPPDWRTNPSVPTRELTPEELTPQASATASWAPGVPPPRLGSPPRVPPGLGWDQIAPVPSPDTRLIPEYAGPVGHDLSTPEGYTQALQQALGVATTPEPTLGKGIATLRGGRWGHVDRRIPLTDAERHSRRLAAAWTQQLSNPETMRNMFAYEPPLSEERMGFMDALQAASAGDPTHLPAAAERRFPPPANALSPEAIRAAGILSVPGQTVPPEQALLHLLGPQGRDLPQSALNTVVEDLIRTGAQAPELKPQGSLFNLWSPEPHTERTEDLRQGFNAALRNKQADLATAYVQALMQEIQRSKRPVSASGSRPGWRGTGPR